jgi:hypothetical protein
MAERNLDPRVEPAKRKMVHLDKVQFRDGRTQARTRMDPSRVRELADVLEAGGEFKEEPELYEDVGPVYWVGDGFHRVAAYELAGRVKFWALVREGTWYRAMLHAAGSNAEHGMPRTRKDLQRALGLLLEQEEIRRYSDRTIARLARCDNKTVAARRKELGYGGDARAYTDKHGNESVMDVSGLRRPTLATSGRPTNTFHELPAGTRKAVKELLEQLSRVPKEHYAFALTWLSKLPATPKEASRLLTELVAEEEQGKGPDGEDKDGLPF